MTIPDVHGLDATTASGRLTTAGLGVVLVTQKIGAGQPSGTVVRMMPDAGAEVASGAIVTLVIAK